MHFVLLAAGFAWKCLFCLVLIFSNEEWPRPSSIDSTLARENNITYSVASASSAIQGLDWRTIPRLPTPPDDEDEPR